LLWRVRDGARPQEEGEHEDRPYTPAELATLAEQGCSLGSDIVHDDPHIIHSLFQLGLSSSRPSAC